MKDDDEFAPYTINSDVLLVLAASRDLLQRPGPLFPNLTSLDWTGGNIHYIRYFLGPKCRRLHILFDDVNHIIQAIILDSMKEKSPLLETISIDSIYQGYYYTKIASTLGAMSNLRAFIGPNITLTIESIAQLSHLSALRDLNCSIVDLGPTQPYTETPCGNVTSKFQALEKIKVTAFKLSVVAKLFAATGSTSVQTINIGLRKLPSSSDFARFFSVLYKECGSRSITHVDITLVSV